MNDSHHRADTVRAPWRAACRTSIVALIALLPLLPEIAETAGIDELPAVASFLAITMAIQRVISLPEVNDWITEYLNLGPISRREARHSDERTAHVNSNPHD